MGPPIIRIAIVGEDQTSNARDLYLACRYRCPVDDTIRKEFDGKLIWSGMQQLQSDFVVEYFLILVPSNDISVRKSHCQNATIIVCTYSIHSKSSRDWLENTFLPEVASLCPNTPIIFVATGIESRSNPIPSEVTALTETQTTLFALESQKIYPNIRAHIECSNVTYKGFRTLADAGLNIFMMEKTRNKFQKFSREKTQAGSCASELLKKKEEDKGGCSVM
jgi:GTPase SAR1 family protein